MSADLNCGLNRVTKLNFPSISSLAVFSPFSLAFPSDQISSRVPLRPGADACPSWRPIRRHWRQWRCAGSLLRIHLSKEPTDTCVWAVGGCTVSRIHTLARGSLPNPPQTPLWRDHAFQIEKTSTHKNPAPKVPFLDSKIFHGSDRTHTSIICSSPPSFDLLSWERWS